MSNPVSARSNPAPVVKTFARLCLEAWYSIKARYRQVRISSSATGVLGPQYRRSRDRIEIDITYLCNLRCTNCNRSIGEAPENLHISLDAIKQFVNDSIRRKKRWKVIRVLGGEPTLHPQFEQVIAELLIYQAWAPQCSVVVVSNGNGNFVQAALAQLPPQVTLENSQKTSNLQPGFGAFNDAPVDDPAFKNADFRNGCDIMEDCGMGLTPLGYYPCAIAGGIDRIAARGLGYQNLPSDQDDMLEASVQLCRLCGHFKEGHCVPQELRAPLGRQVISATWATMFEERKDKRRRSRESKPINVVRSVVTNTACQTADPAPLRTTGLHTHPDPLPSSNKRSHARLN